MWKMVVKLGWMHVITTCSVPVHSCLLCLYSTSYVERWTDAGGTGCRTCCPVMELAAVHMPPHDDLSSPQHLGIMPTLLSTWTHADNIIGSFRKPGKVWEWEWGWGCREIYKKTGKSCGNVGMFMSSKMAYFEQANFKKLSYLSFLMNKIVKKELFNYCKEEPHNYRTFSTHSQKPPFGSKWLESPGNYPEIPGDWSHCEQRIACRLMRYYWNCILCPFFNRNFVFPRLLLPHIFAAKWLFCSLLFHVVELHEDKFTCHYLYIDSLKSALIICVLIFT